MSGSPGPLAWKARLWALFFEGASRSLPESLGFVLSTVCDPTGPPCHRVRRRDNHLHVLRASHTLTVPTFQQSPGDAQKAAREWSDCPRPQPRHKDARDLGRCRKLNVRSGSREKQAHGNDFSSTRVCRTTNNQRRC